MSSTNVLAAKDVNTSAPSPQKSGFGFSDVKSKTKSQEQDESSNSSSSSSSALEQHRQVLQSRMENDKLAKTYISPSDAVMSPCTAKLAAIKQRHFDKAKPTSLFAKQAALRKVKAESAHRMSSLGQDIGEKAQSDDLF